MMNYSIQTNEQFLTIKTDGNLLNAGHNEGFFEELNQKLETMATKNVLLDLSESEYINSSGIGLTVRLHSKLAQAGGMLVIYSPEEKVNKLFKIAKLDAVLGLVYSLEAAKTKLADKSTK